MKILVIGKGGRESAIVWKIAQSPLVNKGDLFCIPGNPGIKQIAKCPAIPEDNPKELALFATNEGIDLVVFGPEKPLCDGYVDIFEGHGLRVVGPNKAAAEIERNKEFAKRLMQAHNIPTPSFRAFTSAKQAKAFIRAGSKVWTPSFVKVSGPALGKGAFRADTAQQALEAVDKLMVKRVFGAAADTVIIEEAVKGREITFTVITDGKSCKIFPISRDFKWLRGQVTGGVGAYCPVVMSRIVREGIMNTVDAAPFTLKKKGELNLFNLLNLNPTLERAGG